MGFFFSVSVRRQSGVPNADSCSVSVINNFMLN
jgi:hypothetical protein